MSIETQPFDFTKVTYFKIMVTEYFKKRWWFFGILLLLALFALFYVQDTYLAANVLSIAVLFGIAMILIFWLYANNYKRKAIFQPRYYRIDENWIETRLHDGTVNRFELKKIKKITADKHYFLLYITKDHFFYIPLSSFKTPEDVEDFKNIINKRNK